MKKTLVALAALAAASAFAQSTVTITGKFGTAYEKNLAQKANIAVTDGDINFAAVEDLGSGMKAGATIGLRTRGRENTHAIGASGNATTFAANGNNAPEAGRDATVWVSGAFGKVTAGSIELGNGITGNGWGGANLTLPTDVNNGGLLSANAFANVLMYSSPAFNGFTVNLARADSIGSVGKTNGSDVISSTAAAAASTDNQKGLTGNVMGVSYANGPLMAAYDSTKFGDFTNKGTAYVGERVRLSASYDLGMAKIGFGQEDNKGSSRDTAAGKQTTYGISAPVPGVKNLTAGYIHAKNTETGSGVKGKANGMVAEYAFSKRTTLNLSRAKITAEAPTAANTGNQFRARLMHSF